MTVQVFDQVAHARAMRAGGYWRDQTIDKTLAKAVSQSPDKFKLRELLATGAARA